MKVVKGKNTLISWRFSPLTGEPEVISCLSVNVYPKSFLKTLMTLGPPDLAERAQSEAEALHMFFLRHRLHSGTRLLNLKDLEMAFEDAEFLVREVLSKERLLELSE